MDPEQEALMQKAHLAKLKKQQVCTDSILKDFNFKLQMPLDTSAAQKSSKVILDQSGVVGPGEAMKKDVRAPTAEFSFQLQTDVHANSESDE